MRHRRGGILHPFIIFYSGVILAMIFIQVTFHPFPPLDSGKVNRGGESPEELKPSEKNLGKERSTATYVMADGDTFESVAEKLRVPVETIRKLNSGIKLGRQIKVPVDALLRVDASED